MVYLSEEFIQMAVNIFYLSCIICSFLPSIVEYRHPFVFSICCGFEFSLSNSVQLSFLSHLSILSETSFLMFFLVKTSNPAFSYFIYRHVIAFCDVPSSALILLPGIYMYHPVFLSYGFLIQSIIFIWHIWRSITFCILLSWYFIFLVTFRLCTT